MSSNSQLKNIFIVLAFFLVAFLPGYLFAATPVRNLSVGAHGADVVALQNFLEKKRFLVIPAGNTKGLFGAATKKALIAYQKSIKVSATGTLGPVTRRYIASHESGGIAASVAVQHVADPVISRSIAPITPTSAPLVYAGWIPYWAKASGTPEALEHLAQFGEISPFAFEVQTNGTLFDKMDIDEEPMATLLTQARSKNVKIIPTLLWIRPSEMQHILSDDALRADHVEGIMNLVLASNFDGIDIDYEGKRAETKPYFSKFLQELSAQMHANKKLLSCTIEARTPAESRFTVVPADLEFSNDYEVINKTCDSVRIMTYDQMNDDIKLVAQKNINEQGTNLLYEPIADKDWVAKVVEQAVKTIDAKKIMLGVATYGYEYEATLGDGNAFMYDRLRAVSYPTALSLAAAVGAPLVRNSAGELNFVYGKQVSGDLSTRLVWLSDSQAISDKIDIARTHGLRGVAIFKLDGQNDPGLWAKLQ